MLTTIGAILTTLVAVIGMLVTFALVLASRVCTLAVQVNHAVAPMVFASWQYVSALVA